MLEKLMLLAAGARRQWKENIFSGDTDLITVEVWVDVYSPELFCFYDTIGKADMSANYERIFARKKVTITVARGEGL